MEGWGIENVALQTVTDHVHKLTRTEFLNVCPLLFHFAWSTYLKYQGKYLDSALCTKFCSAEKLQNARTSRYMSVEVEIKRAIQIEVVASGLILLWAILAYDWALGVYL